MNERIKQLVKQSQPKIDWEARHYGELNNGEKLDYQNQWFEKFAELIVEECARRAEAYAYMSPNFIALAEELRRMKGVEE